jgi:hypothetical protein
MKLQDHDDSFTDFLVKIVREAGTALGISFIPGVLGVIVSVVDGVSWSLSFLWKFRQNSATFIVDLLYGGGSSTLSRQEAVRIALEQVKCAKRKKEYSNALLLIDEILQADSGCAEALLLKALVQQEGFADISGARASLKKLLNMEKKEGDDLWFCWAASLYEELSPHKSQPESAPEQIRIRYE